MTDLAEFLLARIAEDERRARAAAGRIPLIYDEAALRDKGFGIAQAGHIAHWPPARVLAEGDAKRRIVELHRLVTEDYTGAWWTTDTGSKVTTGCDNCRDCGVDGESYLREGPCHTLKLLALPYADDPDYREEWRP